MLRKCKDMLESVEKEKKHFDLEIFLSAVRMKHTQSLLAESFIKAEMCGWKTGTAEF